MHKPSQSGPKMKGLVSNIIPSNFNNLIGLARKLIVAKNPAGKAAMLYSLLGLLMTPLDWAFKVFEKKLYKQASKPVLPQIFVCGPPRSGTTVVAQVLIKYLPVYYFNNLTSVFPNSPIVSNKVFKRLIKKGNRDVSFKSLYGRTTEISSPNDALYLWDRWTGVDRDQVPMDISVENQDKMQRFFAAVEMFSGKPLVNKNNKLNTYANQVAKVLDTAYFICLERNPVYLAQSQLIASRFIHSDERISYGVNFDTNKPSSDQEVIDPIEQVCNQVLRHKDVMMQQESLIGKGRFIIVPYEDFCADPAKWVCKISKDILGITLDIEAIRKTLKPFKVSNTIKLNQEIFSEIESIFEKNKIAS